MKVGNTNVLLRQFTADSVIEECHLVIRHTNPAATFSAQSGDLLAALRQVLAGMPGMTPVMERWFLSDSSTQQPQLAPLLSDRAYAVSIVEQPPLDGTKAALWVQLRRNVSVVRLSPSLSACSHGPYTELVATCMTAAGRDSRSQTRELLLGYAENIGEQGCTLAENCVRTWFFVQNIDVNYSGVVTGRNEVFAAQGLTSDTHFIASTGIGGRTPDRGRYVSMDALAIKGLHPQQISYLYASSCMNRTSDYGVSFERGTRIDYGDRRHLLISGTASIDNRGRVLYPSDVTRQTERMLDNVSQLLSEGGCTFADVMHIIVYLRDIADYTTVSAIFQKRFPDMPLVIVYAPVCRPGWLVEMECMAVRAQSDPRFSAYNSPTTRSNI